MLTTTIVLITLFFIYKWSVSWIEYYNRLDQRFGMSIWRYSYDYQVIGKRDISVLDDKEFVLLRRAISSTFFPNTPTWSSLDDCLNMPFLDIKPKEGL